MVEVKTITVKEFKMWLEGVEEMQEEGWTPLPAQWARIRAKIASLSDADPAPTYTIPTGPIPRAPAPQFQTAGTAPGVRIETSSGPVPPVVNTSGATGLIPSGPTPRGPLATQSGTVPVKTPDIDTSVGPYKSGFA